MGLPVSQHGGNAAAANIAFYYDFASPESYLALERLAKSMAALGPELIPVREADLDPLPMPDAEARQRHIEQRVEESEGVLPISWPEDFPFLDTTDAVTVATYAKSIGKVAVFSLSLFRQIYAGGRDPADRTTSTSPPPPPRFTRARSTRHSRARGRPRTPMPPPRQPKQRVCSPFPRCGSGNASSSAQSSTRMRRRCCASRSRRSTTPDARPARGAPPRREVG